MKKILIVDDETLIRFGLLRAFSNDYQEVKTVENGRDALEEIGHKFYDLCLLDIGLPDLNGIDVMKGMKEISPNTMIAIMTGFILTEDMKQEIEDHASMFIVKPFDLMEVRESIRGVLEKGRAGSLF